MKLFVYGSFCEGMVHYNRLEKFVKTKEPAKIKGKAYQLEVGYPVFLNEGEDWIEGQILTLEANEVLFQLLDEFHGFSPLKLERSLFWKIETTALMDNEQVERVMVYALNPAKLPKKAHLIVNGNWREALGQKPNFLHQLTEKQVNYIKKLGASSGRDIVPIDLDLYRELMKMELIVDKGRRLALTKLGKEVFKYLP